MDYSALYHILYFEKKVAQIELANLKLVREQLAKRNAERKRNDKLLGTPPNTTKLRVLPSPDTGSICLRYDIVETSTFQVIS
jgi:hypothetical protein